MYLIKYAKEVLYFINYPTYKRVINKMLCSKIFSKPNSMIICPLKLHVIDAIESGHSRKPIFCK